MFELPNKPQPIFEIIEDGIKLFLFCFPKVLPLVLADAFFSVLLHLLIPELNSPEFNILMNALINFMGYLLLYMLVMLLLQIAIFYRIEAIIKHSDMDNFEALRLGVKKLLPILLATWLYTFLAGIGLMVLIPGVVLVVSLQFFTPLILFDNAGVLNSLQSSHRLVWGNWWRTAAVLMLSLLIIVLISMMSSTIVEVLLGTIFAQDQINLLMQLTYLIVDKLLSPLFFGIILLQYYDLKRRTGQNEPAKKYFVA